MGKTKIEGYICERCLHQWVSRGSGEPRVCPRCKSPYWNIPKKKKIKNYKRKRGRKDDKK